MKAWLRMLLAVALLPAMADVLSPPAGARAQVALGLRYFYASWEAQDLSIRIREDWEVGGVEGEDYDALVDESETSSPGMIAPEISLRWRRFETALALRLGSFDMELQGEARTEQEGYVTTAAYDFETEVDRMDAELMARWALGGHLRLQAGYRMMRYSVSSTRFTLRRTLQGEDLGETSERLESYERRLQGLGLGLAGHAPILASAYLYASAVFLPWIDATDDASVGSDASFLSAPEDEEGTGWTAEAGIGLLPPGWRVALSLAARAERYDLGDSSELFWGAALGVAIPL